MRCLVTGASGFLGREIALGLASTCDLVLSSRSPTKLDLVLAELPAGNHSVLAMDFLDPDGAVQALTEHLAATKPIDFLVNCAGVVSVARASLLDENALTQAFSVNFFSPFRVAQKLLSRSVNKGALRSAVTLSSIWSGYSSVGHTSYSASKAALDSAFRTMALDHAPRARFNSIALGAIRTPMSSLALDRPDILAKAQKDYPLGVGKPKDVVGLVKFLLSDESSWLTGQTLYLDGGRTAHMSNR